MLACGFVAYGGVSHWFWMCSLDGELDDRKSRGEKSEADNVEKNVLV